MPARPLASWKPVPRTDQAGRTGLRLATAILIFGFALAPAGMASARALAPDSNDLRAAPSSAVQEVETWIRHSGDNQGLPFLIIDKVHARALAYDREGRVLGDAPVLLGLARGDVSPAGIGNRPLSAIGPEDRITPSGRFVSAIGENLSGKNILWIDYDAALSLHPVIAGKPADRRLQRLATSTEQDNRISYGCVNVPLVFYEDVVRPAFEGTTGVVYILPEVRSLADVFFPVP